MLRAHVGPLVATALRRLHLEAVKYPLWHPAAEPLWRLVATLASALTLKEIGRQERKIAVPVALLRAALARRLLGL